MNCIICFRYLQHLQSYKRHLQEQHEKFENELDDIIDRTSIEKKKFKCIKCGQVVSSKYYLENNHKCEKKKRKEESKDNLKIVPDIKISINNDVNDTITNNDINNNTTNNNISNNTTNNNITNNNISNTTTNSNILNIGSNSGIINNGDINNMLHLNNSNNNIENTIKIINFNEDNIFDKLMSDKKFIISLINKLEQGKIPRSDDKYYPDSILEIIYDLIDKLNCNKDYPDNHNIFISNKKLYAAFNIYINDSWEQRYEKRYIIHRIKRIQKEYLKILSYTYTHNSNNLIFKNNVKMQIKNIEKLFDDDIGDELMQLACKRIHRQIYNSNSIIGITYHRSKKNNVEEDENIIKILRQPSAKLLLKEIPIKKQLQITIKNMNNDIEQNDIDNMKNDIDDY